MTHLMVYVPRVGCQRMFPISFLCVLCLLCVERAERIVASFLEPSCTVDLGDPAMFQWESSNSVSNVVCDGVLGFMAYLQ